MSNYILKYSRGNEVKYISHLDFIRTFHRTVRRTNLEMAFSQGFNPHPVMTVALPLSVGVTSESEYMKIGFAKDYEEDYIKDTLNNALPIGFKILGVKKAEGKNPDLTKIDKIQYLVEIETKNTVDLDIKAFLQNEEIIIPKKSKSGIKDANIKPYIYEISVLKTHDNVITMSMCLAAGSSYNLKPDHVIDAFSKYIDGFNIDFFSVHRVSMLAKDKEYL